MSLSNRIYDMVYDDDFVTFNKVSTSMCRYASCENPDCSFAHNAKELKKAICLYHFGGGCTNTASTCKFSHKYEDAVKAYEMWNGVDYKDEVKEHKEEKKTKTCSSVSYATILTGKQPSLSADDIAFHEMVLSADREIDEAISEISADFEEEIALRALEEQELEEEAEEMNSMVEEDSKNVDDEDSKNVDDEELKNVDDEDLENVDDNMDNRFFYTYEELCDIIARQQQLIGMFYTSMTVNQVA